MQCHRCEAQATVVPFISIPFKHKDAVLLKRDPIGVMLGLPLCDKHIAEAGLKAIDLVNEELKQAITLMTRSTSGDWFLDWPSTSLRPVLMSSMEYRRYKDRQAKLKN